MSREPPEERLQRQPLLAAAGILSSGVACELLRPLRELRESLAELVERLDHYAIESRGPLPYPYKETKILREELAEAYLVCRRVTRLTDDLANAVDHRAATPEIVDVNRVMESAINLARHQIAADTEIFIDLGSISPIRTISAELILGISQLLIIAAASARKRSGSAISIKTLRNIDIPRAVDEVVVYIADNGGGCPHSITVTEELLHPLMTACGGIFVGTSELGTGSVFELRFPVGQSG